MNQKIFRFAEKVLNLSSRMESVSPYTIELNSKDEGDNVIAQKVNFEKIDSGKGNDQDNIQDPEAELVASDVSFDLKDCREETKPNLVKFSNITEMAYSRGQSKKIMRR